MSRGLWSLLTLAGLFVACSAPMKAEKLCTPDANVFCRCTDRSEGTKKCKADGQSFEVCLPCDGSGDRGRGAGGKDGLGRRAPDASTEADEDEDEGAKEDLEDEAPPAPVHRRDAGTDASTVEEAPAPESSAPTSASGPAPEASAFPDTPHCKPLTNVAPRVEAQKLADVPTPPAGGKLREGLYVQAWVIDFTGEDGAAGPSKRWSRQTLELMGDVGRFVFEDDDGESQTGGFRLTRAGETKVSVAYECPAAAPKDLAYDASDSTLVIYDPPYARVFYRQVKEGAR